MKLGIKLTMFAYEIYFPCALEWKCHALGGFNHKSEEHFNFSDGVPLSHMNIGFTYYVLMKAF